MTGPPSEHQKKATGTQPPTAVTVLIIATALFTYRAAGYDNLSSVWELLDGIPESWFIPLLGDGLIGTTAIVITILLWRRATFGVSSSERC